MTTIVQLSVRVHNTRVQLNMRFKRRYVSNLPALANISSASVFKPVSKNGLQGVCKVVLKWILILVLEPHSPPTSVPYSHAVLSHISE